MRVRATLTLDLDVESPSEAAKLLEPVLKSAPNVGQFSWTIKGQEWFAERNGRLKKEKVVRVRDRAY